MENKTLGIIQITLGSFSLLIFIFSIIIDLWTGRGIIDLLIRSPLFLLFGLFAVLTGINNLK